MASPHGQHLPWRRKRQCPAGNRHGQHARKSFKHARSVAGVEIKPSYGSIRLGQASGGILRAALNIFAQIA